MEYDQRQSERDSEFARALAALGRGQLEDMGDMGGIRVFGIDTQTTNSLTLSEPPMPEPTPMLSIQGKSFDSEQDTELRLLRKENGVEI